MREPDSPGPLAYSTTVEIHSFFGGATTASPRLTEENMGSLETLILIPLGSIDLVSAGILDSITNTLNGLGLIVDSLFG